MLESDVGVSVMAGQYYALDPSIKLDQLEQCNVDVLVVGAGIAGMTVALSLNTKLNVALVCKSEAAKSSTYKAQGGIAAAVGPEDNPDAHVIDTLRVGQGLCREEAVKVLAKEGPAAIEFLISQGVDFNFQGNKLDLTKEAGHSCHRIVHFYDYTGRQISETLGKRVPRRENIRFFDDCFLVDLLTRNQECHGAVFFCSGRLMVVRAKAVVLASGGYAGLFARSSNSDATSGDGIAAAYRAGATIADMEFVQFHPTTFTTATGEVFLLTEALRGEGSFLRNSAGDRFMFRYHPDGELAPRDEVSRAMAEQLKISGNEVYLDARHLGREHLAGRFRQVYAKLAESNLLLERDLVPVAPAAHYAIGGVLSGLDGDTGISHLYVCGEAASTGVHGANRLASNSLLEGVVFGRRAAWAIDHDFLPAPRLDALPPVEGGTGFGSAKPEILEGLLDKAAGVVRSGEEINQALSKLRQAAADGAIPPVGRYAYQACNRLQLTELLLEAAEARRESRGTHFRSDFPEKNDIEYKKHTIQRWGKEIMLDE